MTTTPDGVITGSISNSAGTKASINAAVSCTSTGPKGTVNGTVEFFSAGVLRKFKFNSSMPFVVATLKSEDITSVGAAFDNVTLQENEFTPLTDCKLYVNATELSTNTWIGSFVVVCPNGEQLFIYGTFTGNVIVNRQVFCTPLL